jgi:putative membrane protein
MVRYHLYICLSLGLGSCSSGSDKKNVEGLNEERFENRKDEREAQFVVDVLDGAYGIMEVAQLGEEKAADAISKARAKKIIEEQTSMIVRLKAYAEENDISIPFSGPARTRNGVKRLYDKEGDDFANEWVEELRTASKVLEDKVRDYLPKSDSTLMPVLKHSIQVLEQNQLVVVLDNK